MTRVPVAETRRTGFVTSDQEKIREFFAQTFGVRLKIVVNRDAIWNVSFDQVQAAGLTATRLRLPGDLRFITEGGPDFVINDLLGGSISHEHGRAVSHYQPGDVFLSTYPGAAFQSATRDANVSALSVPAAVMGSVAGHSPGAVPLSGPARFITTPLDPGARRRWRETSRFVTGLLTDPQTASEPLIHGPAIRLLAATALTLFGGSTPAGPAIMDRHDAHPLTLRLAVAFIDENAHTDITVADIAAATSVTVRAVQHAFRRHLDTTPLAYLRRVRLAHAHWDLLYADPTRTTVTAVAYRWGFPSASRFAASYRRAYGLTPGKTLHGD